MTSWEEYAEMSALTMLYFTFRCHISSASSFCPVEHSSKLFKPYERALNAPFIEHDTYSSTVMKVAVFIHLTSLVVASTPKE